MLKSIKSVYFTQILFAYINEKEKLKIIKYNKSLQKFVNINIINYIHLSRRYVIFESNGKGKEYYENNNELIFEGEYLNKKRHGKGKEYDGSRNLIFVGEYLNGKRHGKGKEYYIEKIKFEGEYLNG